MGVHAKRKIFEQWALVASVHKQCTFRVQGKHTIRTTTTTAEGYALHVLYCRTVGAVRLASGSACPITSTTITPSLRHALEIADQNVTEQRSSCDSEAPEKRSLVAWHGEERDVRDVRAVRIVSVRMTREMGPRCVGVRCGMDALYECGGCARRWMRVL